MDITLNKERVHIYSIILGMYVFLLPINTGLSGLIGSISISNYIAVLFCVSALWAVFKIKKIVLGSEKYILLYFGYTVFTLVWADTIGFNWYVSTFVLNGIMLALGLFIPYNTKDIRVIKNAIIISSILPLIVAIINFSTISSWGRLMIFINDVRMDSNQFSCDMCLALALLLLQVSEERKWKRILSLLLIIIMTVIIFLAGSRSAMIMLIFMILVLVLSRRSNLRSQTFTLVTGILIVAFLIIEISDFLPDSLLNRFSANAIFQGTGSGRYEIWRESIQAFSDSDLLHMVFGHGYGTFGQVVRMVANTGNTYYMAHNVFVQTLIEGGVIGLTLLILAFYKTFRHIIINNNLYGKLIMTGLIVSSLALDMQATRLFGAVFLVGFIFCGNSLKNIKTV